MKFLAFTDIHEKEAIMEKLSKKSQKVDAIICCGDLTFFERNPKKVIDWLASLNKPVIFVHGNHETEEVISHLSAKHKNLNFIHKKVQLFEGINFVGFGGGGFNAREPEFEKFAKGIKLSGKTILITHAPPHGTKLDELFGHKGCKSTREFAEKHSIAYFLCGHFHEHFGKMQKIGKTTYINPGQEGMILELNP